MRVMRAELVADVTLDVPALRAALVDQSDRWLRELFAAAVGSSGAPDDGAVTGISLVAVGSHGRRELAPFSDLDLVLVHEPSARRGAPGLPPIREIADRIWYPIWDARIGLDHSVRTPGEVTDVIHDDLRAQLGMLDLRHIAGDAELSARTRSAVVERWMASAPTRVPVLAAEARTRWALAGEAAFLLEPDVKEARGGLRDIGLLRALALAQLVDLSAAVRADQARLLDVRTALQRVTGRADDVLRLQEQDAVAHALDLADADAVLRLVNETARGVGAAIDDAIRRTGGRADNGGGLVGGLRRLLGRSGPTPAERTPLARDVVAQGGEVVLARDADPRTDPVLLLRTARAAAEHDLPLAPFTLERLAAESPPLPTPWPEAAYTEFVALLGTGRPAVGVIEALDAAGIWERLLPEWREVRFRAQHNPVHRFTVDRHLLETAAESADLTRTVERPDLLLVGALLHDIGKGFPSGDHSVVGAGIARPMAERLGLPADDIEVVVDLVRHHLLLPDTATRRDLDDPVTIRGVADAVESRATLELLHALSIADAAATGPAAWSPWKAGLIDGLVRRTAQVLQGAPLPPPADLSDRLAALAAQGDTALLMTGDPTGSGAEIDVVAPDRRGVLSLTAGVLALHSLDVHSATIRTVGPVAVNSFLVSSRFGSTPDPVVMRQDLDRALAGSLPLGERLRTKEQTYAVGGDPQPSPAHRDPVLLWLDDAASAATVLEVRSDDAIGLLYRVSAALERHHLDIRSARVSSLGRSVVDVFYLTAGDDAVVPPARREAVTIDIRLATAASV